MVIPVEKDFCRLRHDEEKLETIEHIVCYCPKLGKLRFKWLGTQYDKSDCGQRNCAGFVKVIRWLSERQ